MVHLTQPQMLPGLGDPSQNRNKNTKGNGSLICSSSVAKLGGFRIPVCTFRPLLSSCFASREDTSKSVKRQLSSLSGQLFFNTALTPW